MGDPLLLLTPGPLTTSAQTRAAGARDFGSRDPEFIALTAELRRRLLAVAGVDPGFTCVPLQGSGTFAVEAAIGTLVPRRGKLLVLVNGAYGQRMIEIAHRLGRPCEALRFAEDQPVDPGALDRALAADPQVTHVAVVHCETTTGLLNPVEAVGAVTAARERRLLVDAMSAFGALALDVRALPLDALMASSNKCLEGLPGLAYVIAPTPVLAESAGRSPSLALDLHAQWRGLEANGQWRFTPPTTVVAALVEALRQHEAEGGVQGRHARYAANAQALLEGLARLGLRPLLDPAVQAPVLFTFPAPEHPAWDFERFYAALARRGFAIYPGKLTQRPTFRVGCIGQVFPDDLRRFGHAVAEALAELGVETA